MSYYKWFEYQFQHLIPSRYLSGTSMLCYHDVYPPCKPVVFQQTQVPKSLLMGANYVDYDPQGTEVIQVCLQTTPKRGGCNG